MTALAALYAEGKGVEKNEKQALDWLEKACELDSLGSGSACFAIGQSYFEGETGLSKNNQKAFEYAMKTIKQGDNSGVIILLKLEDSGFSFPDAEKEQALDFIAKKKDKQYWRTLGVMQVLKSLQD